MIVNGHILIYLDIDVGGAAQGRLEIDLYPTEHNDLAAHFAKMCAGDFGTSYIGTRFFAVAPGAALWGGDPIYNNSQGNFVGFNEVCICDPPVRPVGPGYLAGVSHPWGFGSQFMLTVHDCGVDYLPGYSSVFGRVRNTESVIFRALRGIRGRGPGVPSEPVAQIMVIGCGILRIDRE